MYISCYSDDEGEVVEIDDGGAHEVVPPYMRVRDIIKASKKFTSELLLYIGEVKYSPERPVTTTHLQLIVEVRLEKESISRLFLKTFLIVIGLSLNKLNKLLMDLFNAIKKYKIAIPSCNQR